MAKVKLSRADKKYIQELFSNIDNIDPQDFASRGNMRIRSHGSLVAKDRAHEHLFVDIAPKDVAIWALWVFGYKWKEICCVFDISRSVASRVAKNVQKSIPSR